MTYRLRIRSAPPTLSEKVFLEQVKSLARHTGWHLYHTFNSMRSTRGFPDLILLRKGRMIVAELKSEKGKVTPEQEAWLEEFRKVQLDCCLQVYVWRPSDWDEIVEIMTIPANRT